MKYCLESYCLSSQHSQRPNSRSSALQRGYIGLQVKVYSSQSPEYVYNTLECGATKTRASRFQSDLVTVEKLSRPFRIRVAKHKARDLLRGWRYALTSFSCRNVVSVSVTGQLTNQKLTTVGITQSPPASPPGGGGLPCNVALSYLSPGSSILSMWRFFRHKKGRESKIA